MTFVQVLQRCISTPELVREFDRLYDAHLSTFGHRSPMDAMIDEATGRDKEALDKFVAFVLAFIWPHIQGGSE